MSFRKLTLFFSCPAFSLQAGPVVALEDQVLNSLAPHTALPEGAPAAPLTPYVKLGPSHHSGALSTELINAPQIVATQSARVSALCHSRKNLGEADRNTDFTASF